MPSEELDRLRARVQHSDDLRVARLDAVRLRSDLLAALLECHDYDSLYKRGMELVDEYKPDS